MISQRYRKSIIVSKEALDQLNHVNNVVFLKWVQDIAGEHWLSRSNEDFNRKYYWVVLNHFIEYKGQAFLDDEIRIETFVEKNEGIRSIRHVEFYKLSKLIVVAKTVWCLIDKERNKPCRIPKTVDAMFFQ